MKKTLTILGSTGSIGRQTLEVADSLGLKIIALTACKNTALLEEQRRKYKPEFTAVDEDSIVDLAGNSGADVIVTAIAGTAGLKPTLAALKTGKRVALANKEPLVCAGEKVIDTARKYTAEIIPVDSEHSAIFQCLAGENINAGVVGNARLPGKNGCKSVKKIILTASGGPFRGKTRVQLEDITPEQALKHPNWSMGKKITIDSATLMNKGLELIEAMHLFGVEPDQIEVVIHPESIIHSMVEFTDGSVKAQLSNPDMRMPIQYAVTYPERLPSLTKPLDITQIKALTFEKPDMETFPCLRLAYEAAKRGSDACAALNQANDEAVELFLQRKIGFNEIPQMIEKALKGTQGT